MRNRMLVTLAILGSAALMTAACGNKKCKTDEDCRSGGKDGDKICYEGRCVSLKGESGKAGPSQGGRRVVDPNATFKVDVDLKKNPSKGPAAAPVTVAEFSDYQCPYCGRAAATMDALAKAFPKAVRIVFMNNPLSFHKQALPAAEAAQAVFMLKGNSAFWKFHDKLFANKRDLGRENLEKWAKELGVDMTKFKAALDKHTYRKMIQDQQKLAAKYGARGAPGFYVNGRFVNGARKLEFFKQKVQQELDRAQKIMAKGVKPKDLYAHIMKTAKTRAVYTK
jgi:protein-disulfide isomerase